MTKYLALIVAVAALAGCGGGTKTVTAPAVTSPGNSSLPTEHHEAPERLARPETTPPDQTTPQVNCQASPMTCELAQKRAKEGKGEPGESPERAAAEQQIEEETKLDHEAEKRVEEKGGKAEPTKKECQEPKLALLCPGGGE